MNISVIGTGDVGSTLGGRWSEIGHTITFGSRNPNSETAQKLIKKFQSITIKDQVSAVKDSDIIVLATPWKAVQETINKLNLKDKVLIDCTNPFNSEMSVLRIDGGISGAEYISSLAPGAKIVKAFNTINTANMLAPMFGIEQASMFICGNELDAKKIVKLLAVELGFEVIDAGDLSVAVDLEHMAALWVKLAYKQNLGNDIAFKLLRK